MNKTRVGLFCAMILMVNVMVWAATVPDTGVMKCYNATTEITCPTPGQAFYGQDANYTINSMSYTKLDSTGNALSDSATTWTMVKDNVTGLIWEMKTNKDGVKNYTDPHDADNTYTWYDSNPATNGGYAGTPGDGTDTEDFIKALNDAKYGGFSDWRLPIIKELAYIIDYSIPDPGPAINTAYFPNTCTFFYWSSTTDAGLTDCAWPMGFWDGIDHDLGVVYLHKEYSLFVRAVRGEQSGLFGDSVIGLFASLNSEDSHEMASNGSYTDNGDGTVTDVSTGLMWQQNRPTEDMTWEEALAYCEGLKLGGYTDWRLPNKNELRSLVDYSQCDPAINTTYFPNTGGSFRRFPYWSSTTIPYNTSSTSFAWFLNFDRGDDGILWDGGGYSPNKANSYYVRAVRGGQSGSLGNLVISPSSRSVPKDAGSTTFGVSITSATAMPWTAAVTSGSEWLTITSSSSGTNTGTITCAYTANTGTVSRKATIRVTATGATGSPAEVTVTQAANTTECTATIDSNLSLHIPLIYHLIPWWGAPSYWADLVYESNPAYPTLIPFKLKNAAILQSGVFSCEAATLSDDFVIHIPDALLPDGITRVWMDLTYSQALSTNGVCFYVSNYGVVAK